METLGRGILWKMPRTKGAKDKVKRKKSGYKTRWRKHRKAMSIKYPKQPKGRKEEIKLWFWEIRPMSKEGYWNFSSKCRKHMRKIVYVPTLRVDARVTEISTKEDIEEFCLNHLYEGSWLIMGFSHAKNKGHCKPVKLASIKITNHPEGLRCKMLRNYRLFRYWFWQGK